MEANTPIESARWTLEAVEKTIHRAARAVQALVVLAVLGGLAACGGEQATVPIDEDDLGGVVTGPDGPEAGVWVIAETRDLPTRFARIVVTDEQGRYLIPDLPEATYNVWTRGYGLVDSPKQEATPGTSLDLSAREAPNPRAAARYYPAGYWFSLIDAPSEREFPGTGADGNGISPNMQTQAEFLRIVKSGYCMACHQLGSIGTRTIPESIDTFETSEEVWERRVQSGQAGGSMIGGMDRLGRERALEMFANWTDTIAAGAVPPRPPRPEGLERNVVITQWDWADPTAYLHDLASTDRRDPTVNANGPIYGALELSADYLPVLDPETHETSRVPLHVLNPEETPIAPSQSQPAPSPYWGDSLIWNSKANVHNPMLDDEGRVWITATARPYENQAHCREGSDHPSAQLFPLERSYRHLGMYDPETDEYTPIPTCFSTHHLMFSETNPGRLWTSGGGSVVGYLNTEEFLKTGDAAAAQGWSPFILDTNGNGERDEYVGPGEPVDPSMDKRVNSGLYAVNPAPDGTIWGSSLGYPGAVVRVDPGPNPPETALTEVYELPLDENGEPVEGFSPRGMDIDRNGIAWVALASGHLGRFDRSACEGPLNGPDATGQHCPEGWTFYTEPLPQIGGVDEPGSAESSYFTWVDQFNTLGLGENVPINTGNESEALLALDDGEWVVLRVPYPLGFYTKWMDGRIDDPDAGWKGRGIWATVSTRTPFHMEGGQGTTSKVFKFQMRPNPLAR